MSRVVVVGAGFAGLAAACTLAAQGHAVTVIDRRPRPGGRAAAEVGPGYSLDLGPIVLTMVATLSAVFRAAGADIDDYLELRRVDPSYRMAFADATHPEGAGVLRTYAEPARMDEEIRRLSGPRAVAEWHRWQRWLEELAGVELPHFIDADATTVARLLERLPALWRLWRLGGFRRLDALASATLSDPRLRRAVTFQALYAGLAPQQARGLFGVIAYMDLVLGVYWPRGGMARIGAALAELAELRGATLRLDEEVTAYEVQGRRVVAVRSPRGRYPSDLVVTTEDPLALAARLNLRYGHRRWRLSPSALVRVRAEQAPTPPDLEHHNIFFGRAWASAFRDLIDEGRLMRDPSILVSLPHRSDPALVSPGARIVYALEPVPNLRGHVDWTHVAPLALDRLETRLREVGLARVDEPLAEITITPLDWAAQGMDAGTPFSLAHTFFQSGPFRTPMAPRDLDNVLIAGAGTHPGVGVPLALRSGLLAAERARRLLDPPRRPHR